MHISHTKYFNIPVLIALATLAHMINVYEICLNTTNYLIYSICKISDIAWVSRYPHHVVIASWYDGWHDMLDCFPSLAYHYYIILLEQHVCQLRLTETDQRFVNTRG